MSLNAAEFRRAHRVEFDARLGEENLTFQLPTCVVALEQDQVSCPNPAEIPVGYRQVQETGQWICSPGYYGTALRECTLLRVQDACLLQAVFSGCAALTGCLPPNPASDYAEGRASNVPACGYDTGGCENVTSGRSWSMLAEEAGPGYAYDAFTDEWSCTSQYTGRAVNHGFTHSNDKPSMASARAQCPGEAMRHQPALRASGGDDRMHSTDALRGAHAGSVQAGRPWWGPVRTLELGLPCGW
eukprot:Skav226796  [mRNA]  locus=scaffold8:539920:549474:+ [translate_table: standard]